MRCWGEAAVFGTCVEASFVLQCLTRLVLSGLGGCLRLHWHYLGPCLSFAFISAASDFEIKDGWLFYLFMQMINCVKRSHRDLCVLFSLLKVNFFS